MIFFISLFFTNMKLVREDYKVVLNLSKYKYYYKYFETTFANDTRVLS